ncbi:PREDICTED: uncharacterized protein LOC104820807 [Tarenaya hassleriana]|uniref:uncharacterized protein LOC104820807 n=1 Tax=Tarenaya hassleriana TaxID=28532 RepID=UPI00053C2F4C|nr:PREDICTED: uncharacterized protein LOC104820807 [Tarenaya hassleriana]
MAVLLKTPSLRLSSPPLHAPDLVPFKPFCVSFAGGRISDAVARVSFSRRTSCSLRFDSGQSLRLLRFVGFASGETETTETEAEAGEPEIKDTDGAVGVEGEDASAEGREVEEAEASVVMALLQSYKEALANNDEGKVAEIEASLKAIEDEKIQLGKKIASLSDELSVERDRVLRISADFDNFRKRTERERLSLVSNAQGEVVENLLSVLDNFERAKTQIKVESEGEEKITNSYQSIYKQFVEILGSLGVVPVETVGKQFDPMQHEAIMREDSSEFEEGIILEEYRKGFMLGDRLLRPSMVKVSAGPGPAKAHQEDEKPGGEEAGESNKEGEDEAAATSS